MLQQRGRGAYIATVCQPKSTYDLSFVAQATDPQEENIKQLNKRTQWQKLDLNSLSLLVLTDTLVGLTIALGSKHVTPLITRRFRHPFLIWGEALRTYVQERD